MCGRGPARRQGDGALLLWRGEIFHQKGVLFFTPPSNKMNPNFLYIIRKLIYCKCQSIVLLETELNIPKRVLYLIINRYMNLAFLKSHIFVSRTSWNTILYFTKGSELFALLSVQCPISIKLFAWLFSNLRKISLQASMDPLAVSILSTAKKDLKKHTLGNVKRKIFVGGKEAWGDNNKCAKGQLNIFWDIIKNFHL